MKSETRQRLDEWLAELAERPAAAKGDDPGATMQELREATGLGMHSLRDRLQRLAAEGRLAVGRAVRPSLAGVRQPVPVYRLADPPKRKR